jgi:hypothetical protein
VHASEDGVIPGQARDGTEDHGDVLFGRSKRAVRRPRRERGPKNDETHRAVLGGNVGLGVALDPQDLGTLALPIEGGDAWMRLAPSLAEG